MLQQYVERWEKLMNENPELFVSKEELYEIEWNNKLV